MLESNTFRMMMMIGGVIIFGVVLVGFFKMPMVELDPSIPEEKRIVEYMGKEELSAFDVAMYYIKAKPRGNIRHY